MKKIIACLVVMYFKKFVIKVLRGIYELIAYSKLLNIYNIMRTFKGSIYFCLYILRRGINHSTINCNKMYRKNA